VASASFDGKILIASTQSTNSKPEDQAAANQALDDSDFFAKAQTQPQGITFSIPRAPKYLARPSSVSFGFGGKLVRLSTDASKKSKVSIETFAVESGIGESTTQFEEKLQSGDLSGICESKIQDAKTDEEKADWQVIETLNTGKSRKKLREYLGFSDDADDELAKETEKLGINGDADKPTTNGDKDDDDFFGSADDSDNFLTDLAATKGTKTNNPFSIHTGEESAADKGITQALMLGKFDAALDICLKEDRMSDAFMIAVCGGQACIDKAQSAYLKKQAKGPNYLRLLASIVGKNLWDVVHNADLKDWKDVMATLCTYADNTEFSDLCEALGDRLEEAYQQGGDAKTLRRDASFCYLAGSKLEKVVINWVQELQEQEKSALEASESENDFAVHAKALQSFIEKVSVFRQVANFEDGDKSATADWKLAPLYKLYVEYADILAAHGQLASAERYISLLPAQFEGADSAQARLKQATTKKAAAAVRQPAAAQRAGAGARPVSVAPQFQAAAPLINQATNAAPMGTSSPYAPVGMAPIAPAAASRGPYAPAANSYTPSGYQPPNAPAPYGQPAPYGGGYQPPQQQASLPPPPRAGTTSPSGPPPSAAKSMTNWNDMPDNFLKTREPTSRRGTPAQQPIASPFPNAAQSMMSPPPPGSSHFNKPTPPLPPPPKAGETPRVLSPPVQAPFQRPTSAAANAYAPPPPAANSNLPTPSGPPIQRGASPFQPPPSISSAAPSNRYAPAPGSAPSPAPNMQAPRQVAPNPYAAQGGSSPYAPQSQPQTPYGQPPPGAGAGPPPQRSGPPPQGPPRGAQTPVGPPPQGPPRGGPPPSAQAPPPQAQPTPPPPSARSSTPAAKSKHPRGDRSHVPANAQPIIDLLSPEVARIKAVAPQAFKPQVDDMDKRINILFDHLNNEELLKPDTVGQMVEISRAVASKEWDRAQALFTEMQSAKLDTEGTLWMASSTFS
jgi:protein transport protein SEC31